MKSAVQYLKKNNFCDLKSIAAPKIIIKKMSLKTLIELVIICSFSLGQASIRQDDSGVAKNSGRSPCPDGQVYVYGSCVDKVPFPPRAPKVLILMIIILIIIFMILLLFLILFKNNYLHYNYYNSSSPSSSSYCYNYYCYCHYYY